MSPSHIIAVDQSTAATKAFLLDEAGRIVARTHKAHQQFYPQPGFVEHDAAEIWRNVEEGIRALAAKTDQVAAIAISNQRETTVFWHRDSGEPLCPAIVWQDVRGNAICEELAAHEEEVSRLTGIDLSAYFPAAKAAAKLRERPDFLELARENKLCIGTVDSYLVFRLTQGASFTCDVSNASRTQLMDLNTLRFSPWLCDLFGIPINCLPQILPSDAVFGQARLPGLPDIPIVGVMGDSHAAFFGHGCEEEGMVKASFGTGSSVMMNIGTKPLCSQSGLSTSVGYSYQGKTCYVLEGNVTASGDTLRWLIDEAGLARDFEELERLAAETPDANGVYLVPAFSGLGTPYNQAQSRALICGLNRGRQRRHILRAGLESLAYQDAAIIAAMEEDTGFPVKELMVDGGPASNATLMQFLSDVTGRVVRCAQAPEQSALGAAKMAALALGIPGAGQHYVKGVRYEPKKDQAWRREKMNGWQTAVMRCI